MALKSLTSVFLSPLSLPYSSSNPTPKFSSFYTKPTPISCQTQARQQAAPTSDPYRPESDGLGAAAPTRGDLFLEHHQSVAASEVVFNANKKKKKVKFSGSWKASAASACYGCGAPLQTLETDAPGYVDPETYELKKKHHQLRTVLCGRCRLLSHGQMITAVGGNGGYSGGKQFISAEELREKLSHLRHEKALIVKLVDIVDFNGSFLARVRDLAGANPIILVVTKVDLLPKETDLNCVGDWVVEATMKKKLNVLSVHLTSSKSLVGISGVASEIQKEKKGSANVGKSAFINALLKMMAQRDPAAAAAQRYKPIQSAVPGTTLGPIQIDAFLGGGKLYDTPGVHLHHRQAAVVHSEDLPALAPRSRLRGQCFPNFQVAFDDSTLSRIKSNGLNGFSIFWGGLVRIDIVKVLPQTRLTFYGPKALNIHMVPTDKADEFYQKELGVLLTPPTGKQRAEDWLGLETERQLQIKFEDSDSYPFEFKPVEIFVRPPIPVGKGGGEWYQYRELTEKEVEVRPQWYF
ncbi:hypothetical protein AAG906_035568 [Vitis piasezkii]